MPEEIVTSSKERGMADVGPDLPPPAHYTYGGDSAGGTHSVLVALVPSTAVRVLDIGCASGYLGRELMRTRQCEVWGVDANPDSAAAARAAGYSDVLCADLDSPPALPWPEPFDAVLAGNILEHLRNPENILGRVRELLKPGAPLVVALPNVANAKVRVDLLRGRFDYTDTGILDRTHLHLYTYDSARALLTDNGFAIRVERAGSRTFGRFLNGRVPGAKRLAPLLANTIIMQASVRG
jgi:2-polyprenyl-3-methyl-5-hydroxy-6-metoxy-1,4-benzoquinol methylase